MRFELVLLAALAAVVVAQDDLGELELIDEFAEADPELWSWGTPGTPGTPGSSGSGSTGSGSGSGSGGKDNGQSCKVAKKYSKKYNNKSSKFIKGNCKQGSVCDTRFGKKSGEGKCRPGSTCTVRHQDCKKRNQFCAFTTASGSFWGSCTAQLANKVSCVRDYQCKSGNCEDNKDNLSSKCASKGHKDNHNSNSRKYD